MKWVLKEMSSLKRIIPIVITIVVCVYLFVYAVMTLKGMSLSEPLGIKLFMLSIGAISIGIMFAMVIALFRRLREIKEEEDDDISKY